MGVLFENKVCGCVQLTSDNGIVSFRRCEAYPEDPCVTKEDKPTGATYLWFAEEIRYSAQSFVQAFYDAAVLGNYEVDQSYQDDNYLRIQITVPVTISVLLSQEDQIELGMIEP